MSSSKYAWAQGYWNAIHITAAWCDTPEKNNFFYQWIRIMIDNMPCGDCVRHGQGYVKSNPPEHADDPFIWTWEYHNAVNKLSGKPEIEYASIKKMYLEGGIRVCESGCGEGSSKSRYAGPPKFRPNRY